MIRERERLYVCAQEREREVCVCVCTEGFKSRGDYTLNIGAIQSRGHDPQLSGVHPVEATITGRREGGREGGRKGGRGREM